MIWQKERFRQMEHRRNLPVFFSCITTHLFEGRDGDPGKVKTPQLCGHKLVLERMLSSSMHRALSYCLLAWSSVSSS
jgi:hypothetical protein